ncbi:hypothetical protein NL676_002677 [Syzygium grande]|nr:hypothetical protein NL676_002677 [Syzygium grande]
MQMGLMAAALVALLAHPSSAQSTSGCTTVLMTLTPCLNCLREFLHAVFHLLLDPQLSRPVVAAVPLLAGQWRHVAGPVQQSDPCSGSRRRLQREDPIALTPSSPPTASPPADSSDNTPATPTASSTPSVPSGSKTTPAATNASGSIKASFGSLAFALLLVSFGSGLLKS